MATSKRVMVVGIDGSDRSASALVWAIDHFLMPMPIPLFQLILVYAKPSISDLDLSDEEEAAKFDKAFNSRAAKAVQRAKELCIKKSVNDVEVEVMEGDARCVLCDAVNKHHASILVVGSHGSGADWISCQGRVSNNCARHAQCTVIIVKKPEPNHYCLACSTNNYE